MAETQTRPVGRPPIAATVADIHVRVPAHLYDPIAVEAIRRDVPVARVVRDALEAWAKR